MTTTEKAVSSALDIIIPKDIDFEQFLNLNPDSELRSPSEFVDDLIDEINGRNLTHGALLPWVKSHELFQMRPSEVTCWAGINGHGKSMMTSQVALSLVEQGHKVVMASMEMPPVKTLRRMAQQGSGVMNPSDPFVRHFMEYLSGNLYIYDRLDVVPAEDILGMIAYAATQLGAAHVFIDSLMKCGVADDDIQAQKYFVDRLCQIAKQYKIHIHLVAHMRKGESENKRPNKFDVMGSSHITNLIDNLAIVHSNKAKQELIASGVEVDDDQPDFTLGIAKQRHGEFEGTFALWFDRQSVQFCPNSRRNPTKMKCGFAPDEF